MKLTKQMIIFVEFIVGSFFVFAGYLCIELAGRTAFNMVFIPLPKSTIYYTVMTACFLMALFSLINIYRFSKLSAQEVYTEKIRSNRVMGLIVLFILLVILLVIVFLLLFH